jgi:hypothetical protein
VARGKQEVCCLARFVVEMLQLAWASWYNQESFRNSSKSILILGRRLEAIWMRWPCFGYGWCMRVKSRLVLDMVAVSALPKVLAVYPLATLQMNIDHD